MLRDVVTNDNTASDVWADTAYRSQANERWLRRNGKVSRIHRKKPRGKPMPERTAKANAAKSSVRAHVEHVFAHQRDKMGLFIRTIGIKRAEAKVAIANLATTCTASSSTNEGQPWDRCARKTGKPLKGGPESAKSGFKLAKAAPDQPSAAKRLRNARLIKAPT
jgi:hypothetical protein